MIGGITGPPLTASLERTAKRFELDSSLALRLPRFQRRRLSHRWSVGGSMGVGLTGGLVEALGFGELGGVRPACHNGRRSLGCTVSRVCIDRSVSSGAPCCKNTSCSTLNLIIQLFLKHGSLFSFDTATASVRPEGRSVRVGLSPKRHAANDCSDLDVL